MSAILYSVTLLLGAGDSVDALVLCPEPLQASLAPWVQYRQQQGYQLRVVAPDATAEGIRQTIRREAERGGLRYLVLVGDAQAQDAASTSRVAVSLPAAYIPAKVNRQWGSEAEIATDNAYADLDGDTIPELAVGRITADTPDEVSRIVHKIMAYESAADCRPWRRRVNVVAGVGGFGTLADSVLEMAAKKLLSDGIPAGYHTTMTYGSWQSPYCPDPRRFHDVALQRITEGCLFWIYIGHGRQRHLDHVRVPGGAFPILDADDTLAMRCPSGPPIALMLACYTGAFDDASDCLAEDMLRAAGGPVAVIGGSRVTMPYAMAVMGTALMDEYFLRQPPTLGQLLLDTKRRTMADHSDDRRRQLLDAIAAAISPAPDQLLEERREHLSLLNLIGDPLLQLRYPQPVRLQAPAQVQAGDSLDLIVQIPFAGRCRIELACRRDRSRLPAPSRPVFQPTERFLTGMDEAYEAVNDPVWTSQTVDCTEDSFECRLVVPETVRGACTVRAYHVGQDDYALGACELFVRRPRE
jgi:hypothetical protein